nr:CYP340K7 [Helicoverpa armigera]
MMGIIFFVCVLFLVCLKFKVFGRNRGTYTLPPKVPGWFPIIGHLHQAVLSRSNLLKFVASLSESCEKLGGVAVFNFGNELYYLITNPQDAIIAGNSCINRHYAYDFCKIWLGHGLATATEETWRHRRKLLNPAFSLPVIHGFLDVFNSQAKKLINELEPHIGKGPFDHSLYFKKNAVETLCVGTFGIKAIEDVNFIKKYTEAVSEMVSILVSKFFKFWLQSYLICKLTGIQDKEDSLVETMHNMSDKVIREKRQILKKEALNKTEKSEAAIGIEYRPFLDLLLELSANGALTDKQIREELNTIIGTGFETTSSQLMFSLMLLGSYPEVQEKMYQELLTVLGPDRDVERDDLTKLVYTNAVIMETLRVLPTIPCILRCVEKDVKLTNYTMQAGSYCLIFPMMTNIVSTWNTKTSEFSPEGWLNGDFKNNQEFAAFGVGKRGCIGRTYAMIVLKVQLAHFIRRYRVKADMTQLKLNFDFVLKPESGHEISIERRM